MKIKLLRYAVMLLLASPTLSKMNSQTVNDVCETATPVLNVLSDTLFVCIESTNLDALPEVFNNGCQIGEFPTVWFQVNTDSNATLMNIQVSSQDFVAPTINLFLAAPDCSNLQPVDLTQSDYPCIVGSNGKALAIASNVDSNSVYYIAVSSLNSPGGDFELCVNTISDGSLCVTSRSIEITSRSAGGPLSGPFFPGETIGVCMKVDSFDGSSGCQWFQGLVPVFGNGWDTSSFDANGQPENATINGMPMGVVGNGVYEVTFNQDYATWDWFSNVGHHWDNEFLQVGDLDGNGSVEMCNILYDPDCPNLGGITGGCCGACWLDPGDILPPGWFAYGINGSCAEAAPPINFDWGDGISCNNMGSWSFCFELKVRDIPDCETDSSTMDLSLGFFTFADGQTGSWTGDFSLCAFDQPTKLILPFCCSESDSTVESHEPLCSGQVFEYNLDQAGVDYWYWTTDSSGITGANDGEGVPGSLISDTLINNGSFVDTVVYTFYGYAGSICTVHQIEVSVIVYPELQLILDPPSSEIAQCLQDGPICINAIVSGGIDPHIIEWFLPDGSQYDGETICSMIPGPHIVVVTDDAGCQTNDTTNIIFYEEPTVFISSGDIAICQGNFAALEAIVNGGEPPFHYQWMTPTGFDTSQIIIVSQAGIYSVSVEDFNGCTSNSDTIVVYVLDVPFVELGPDSIVVESLVVLDAGNPGATFLWNTGDITQTLLVTTPGLYFVQVTDQFGCIGADTIYVEVITSIQPLSESDGIKLSPNPTKGVFTISAELATPEEMSVKVFNSIGQIVFSSDPEIISEKNAKEIHLRDSRPGIYYVLIRLGSKEYMGKLVVSE